MKMTKEHFRKGGLVLTTLVALLSLSLNIYYGYSNYAGWEKWAYIALGTVSDCLKTILPIFIFGTVLGGLTVGRVLSRLAGLSVILVSLLFSLFCAHSLYIVTKEKRVAEIKAEKLDHADLKEKIKAVGVDIVSLQKEPTKAVYAEQIAGMKSNPIWKRTRQCSSVTRPDSQAWCSKLDARMSEMAAARTRSAIGADIVSYRARLSELEAELEGIGNLALTRREDPAAEIQAKSWGIHPDTVRSIPAYLMAIIADLTATFGFMWFGQNKNIPQRPSKAPARRAAIITVREPEYSAVPALTDQTEPITDTPVAEWASVALVKRSGSHIPAAELMTLYNGYAEHHGLVQLNATSFGIAMKQAGYAKKKSGSMVYTNIALKVDQPSLRLVADNQGPAFVHAS